MKKKNCRDRERGPIQLSWASFPFPLLQILLFQLIPPDPIGCFQARPWKPVDTVHGRKCYPFHTID